MKTSDCVTRAKKRPAAGVRKVSGTVCWQTRMVARRRDRAAGSRPRDRSERLLLLFAAEKQKKEKEGGIEKGLLGLSSLIWVEVKSSRLCHEGEEEACGRGAESVGDGLLANPHGRPTPHSGPQAAARVIGRSGFCCFSPPKSRRKRNFVGERRRDREKGSLGLSSLMG